MADVTAACEACGWAAAFCSMLAFGTFGVPIKSQAAVSVDIDPLVFQTYKTFMCFVTSWLVLLAGEGFIFTPWGIVSGFFWVPGGVATIYAVKNAGLAIGIGIGSSFIVLVSFIWGIFIFEESVHSRTGASIAIFSMMLGLLGMSYFSSPESVTGQEQVESSVEITLSGSDDAENPRSLPRRSHSGADYQGLVTEEDEDEEEVVDGESLGEVDDELKMTERTEQSGYSDNLSDDGNSVVEADASVSRVEGGMSDPSTEHVVVCGIKLTKRQTGMLAAAFCGIWGGSILAPMKFCKSDTKGTHYLISFAIGSSLVTLAFWIIRYWYNVFKYKSMVKAYSNLPSFHIRTMWLAGGLSGTLWSIGNFFSLISVFYLGEGVGYPLVQTSILVSGLWGIFYFKEVTGTERISKWLLSSLMTIFGILLLSYEHHAK
jgi:glucose uptake protein GlcU